MGNDGPLAILNGLRMKYLDQPHLLQHLPKRAQIKSRKGYLMSAAAKATQIETFADLYQWAHVRTCTTESKFFNDGVYDRFSNEAVLNKELAGVENEVLVLKCFDHRYEDEGVSEKSLDLILTTRLVFRNVLYAVEGRESDGVFAATDGTYKLHFGTINASIAFLV
ncbi:hypothetical protein PRIC1_002431 [Phytophthora ramorum]